MLEGVFGFLFQDGETVILPLRQCQSISLSVGPFVFERAIDGTLIGDDGVLRLFMDRLDQSRNRVGSGVVSGRPCVYSARGQYAAGILEGTGYCNFIRQ